MKILFLFFRPFYVLWCLLWFLALMFIVFPFVILASFWGRYAGGNAIFKALHFWSDIWFLMCGLRVSITYEVPHNPPFLDTSISKLWYWLIDQMLNIAGKVFNIC